MSPRRVSTLPASPATGPSCRLAMNGYTDLSHSFEARTRSSPETVRLRTSDSGLSALRSEARGASLR